VEVIIIDNGDNPRRGHLNTESVRIYPAAVD
jgi:hypothetical protein